MSATPLSLPAGTGTATGTLPLNALPGAALTASPVSATVGATSGLLTSSSPLSVSVSPPPPGSIDSTFGTADITTLTIPGGGFDVARAATSNGTQTRFVVKLTANGACSGTLRSLATRK